METVDGVSQSDKYNPHLDEIHRREEAVFSLFDAVTTGMELPRVAQVYFGGHPEVLHTALDELSKRLPNKVMQSYVDRLKAQYSVEK
jgi:hypothetical protein